jgi:hypothetical protein
MRYVKTLQLGRCAHYGVGKKDDEKWMGCTMNRLLFVIGLLLVRPRDVGQDARPIH